MAPLGRLFVTAGVVLIVLGLLLMSGTRVPLLGFLGRLPGDIRIERPGLSFYFPITSSILVSVGLSFLLRLVLRR